MLHMPDVLFAAQDQHLVQLLARPGLEGCPQPQEARRDKIRRLQESIEVLLSKEGPLSARLGELQAMALGRGDASLIGASSIGERTPREQAVEGPDAFPASCTTRWSRNSCCCSISTALSNGLGRAFVDTSCLMSPVSLVVMLFGLCYYWRQDRGRIRVMSEVWRP